MEGEDGSTAQAEIVFVEKSLKPDGQLFNSGPVDQLEDHSLGK